MRMIRYLAAAALVAALAGCQAEKQESWDYGRSFHTVFESQKVDPTAGDDSPMIGMDGQRATLAHERLEKQAPEEKKQHSGGFEAFLQQKN